MEYLFSIIGVMVISVWSFAAGKRSGMATGQRLGQINGRIACALSAADGTVRPASWATFVDAVVRYHDRRCSGINITSEINTIHGSDPADTLLVYFNTHALAVAYAFDPRMPPSDVRLVLNDVRLD